MIVADIQGNGGVVARWWDKSMWSTATNPILRGSPKGIKASEGFTAISGHAERKMYGIVNGEIHEWSFDTETPMEWTYNSQVKTSLGED